MNNYSSPRSPLPPERIRVGLLGYTGYSGAELMRILAAHPRTELFLLDHRRADGAAGQHGPEPCGLAPAREIQHLPWSANAVREHRLDVVLTATPPEVSLEVIPDVLGGGARAIDLSGAFRLRSAEEYQRWYGATHTQPQLLAEAVYGLPELYRDKLRTACLVSNPGCYPTAAICALWPLVQGDVIDRAAGVICDAKSGVSGAGKAPSPKTHFVQVAENFSAYAVLKHRHVPEVTNTLGLAEAEFSFTAHLLPIQRGILATHYVRLKQRMGLDEVYGIYRKAYAKATFVRLYPQGAQPQVSDANHTNYCDIHCTLGEDGRRLVVVSCIDNLIKGAAGQAVQNFNVMFGLEESAGLLE